MRYIKLIESFYPSFSKKEKKIASYIINEKKNICFMSLTEISEKIQVSEATIVRFVQKIGFKGFTTFKLEIAKDTSVNYEMKSKDYIDNIHKNMLDVINSTKGLIKKEYIEEAITYIENSKDMYVYGLGASGIATQELQNRFLRYGKMSHSACDGHLQTMYSSLTKKNDLIIAITLSGETPELIYPIKLAKENGAKIIVISNYILSTVAKLADVVLLTSGRETPLDGGSIISKISQLYVIDILATGYALKNKKRAEECKTKVAVAISNKTQN